MLKAARGLKVGEFLLLLRLWRAPRAWGMDKIYLLTNSQCAAAIHLYQKRGFVHDPAIMADFGARYAPLRCGDVLWAGRIRLRRRLRPSSEKVHGPALFLAPSRAIRLTCRP